MGGREVKEHLETGWGLRLVLAVAAVWLLGAVVLTVCRWSEGLDGVWIDEALAVGLGAVLVHGALLLGVELVARFLLPLHRLLGGRESRSTRWSARLSVAVNGGFGVVVGWICVEALAQTDGCSPPATARLAWVGAAVLGAGMWVAGRRKEAAVVGVVALVVYGVGVFPVLSWKLGGGAARREAVVFVGEPVVQAPVVRWRDALWAYDRRCQLFEYREKPPILMRRESASPESSGNALEGGPRRTAFGEGKMHDADLEVAVAVREHSNNGGTR